MLIQYSLILAIAGLAYLVKGLTGFGPAIVFISIGSLVMDPIQVVAVSPLLDVLAGSILLWKDRRNTSPGYWLILSVPLLAGVVIGSTGLHCASSQQYSNLLGSAIAILGLWFFIRSYRNLENRGETRRQHLPDRPEKLAMFIAVCSGISGGLFGISGPPLIWYFGTRYQRHAFRRIVIPLFLVEASGRALIYAGMGMLGSAEIILVGGLIPSVLGGLFLGNRWFNIIPEHHFLRVIGVVLIAAGIRQVMM